MKLFHNWKAMAVLVASTMVVGSMPISASNTESAESGIQNFSEEQVVVNSETENEEETPAEEEVPPVEETSAKEEVPPVEEAPAKEEVPPVEEAPAEEEVPSAEEAPAEEEVPSVEIQTEEAQPECAPDIKPDTKPGIFTKAHTIITMPQQEFVYDGTPKGGIELSCDDPDCTAEFTGKCTIAVNKIGELSGITHEWPTDAGRYHVVVNYYGDDNHHFEWEAFEFVIKKANVTITADDKSKEYSDEDPELTYSVTSDGQLEDTSFLDGKVAIYREAGEDVGVYPIHVKWNGRCSTNYNITTVDGSFEITRKVLVFDPSFASKVYGEADPEGMTWVIFDGNGDLYENQMIADDWYKVVREEGEDVGNYRTWLETVGQPDEENFELVLREGTFEITPMLIGIEINDAKKTYGDKDPEFSYIVYKDGEEITIPDGIYEITREEGEDVGEYALTLSQVVENANYKLIGYDEGVLTIMPKDITVTIDNKEKKVGDKDPEFTYKVFDEDNKAIDVALNLVREAGEKVGKYEISVGDADVNKNYNMTVTNGILEIKESTNPTPDKPDKPSKPDDKKNDNNKTDNKTTTTTSPKTADETPVIPFASAAVVALGAIVIFLKKVLRLER